MISNSLTFYFASFLGHLAQVDVNDLVVRTTFVRHQVLFKLVSN